MTLNELESQGVSDDSTTLIKALEMNTKLQSVIKDIMQKQEDLFKQVAQKDAELAQKDKQIEQLR